MWRGKQQRSKSPTKLRATWRELVQSELWAGFVAECHTVWKLRRDRMAAREPEQRRGSPANYCATYARMPEHEVGVDGGEVDARRGDWRREFTQAQPVPPCGELLDPLS